MIKNAKSEKGYKVVSFTYTIAPEMAGDVAVRSWNKISVDANLLKLNNYYYKAEQSNIAH